MRGNRFLLGAWIAVLSGCGASSLLGDRRDGAVTDASDAPQGVEDGAADVMTTDVSNEDSGPPRCGALFERCCETTCTEANTYCNPTDNRCGPCGGAGQRCCGSMCLAGTCMAGICPRPSCVGSTDRACSVIEVPGGTFTVAETIAGQQQPNITVGAFAIDATEVTVRRFRRYFPDVSRTPPRPPATVRYPGGVFALERQVFSPSDPIWMSPPGAAEDHPITAVWFNAAQAFCVADGGRLPTEAEFEWVAYGMVSDGRARPRAFAWGAAAPSPTCDRAHWNNCPGDDGRRTRRVASFAPTGAFFDLTGNGRCS
jgi:hypothetical protein